MAFSPSSIYDLFCVDTAFSLQKLSFGMHSLPLTNVMSSLSILSIVWARLDTSFAFLVQVEGTVILGLDVGFFFFFLFCFWFPYVWLGCSIAQIYLFFFLLNRVLLLYFAKIEWYFKWIFKIYLHNIRWRDNGPFPLSLLLHAIINSNLVISY